MRVESEKQRRAREDQLGREIDAERLDNHVEVLECIPDGIAIERVA